MFPSAGDPKTSQRDDVARQYQVLLKQARRADLSDVAALKFCSVGGSDKMDRRVVSIGMCVCVMHVRMCRGWLCMVWIDVWVACAPYVGAVLCMCVSTTVHVCVRLCICVRVLYVCFCTSHGCACVQMYIENISVFRCKLRVVGVPQVYVSRLRLTQCACGVAIVSQTVSKNVPPKCDMDRILMYMINAMDSIVNKVRSRICHRTHADTDARAQIHGHTQTQTLSDTDTDTDIQYSKNRNGHRYTDTHVHIHTGNEA